MYRLAGVIYVIFLIGSYAHCQQWNTSSKKAIKNIEAGMQQMALGYTEDAIESFNNAIKADEGFVEAYLGLGQLYEDLGQLDKATGLYQKGHELNPGLFNQTLMGLGRVAFYSGNYILAKESFLKYLDQPGISASNRHKVHKWLDNCDFAIKAMQNPLPFKPVNLGPNINTKYNEYWPSLSADEEVLVFTAMVPVNENMKQVIGNWQEDFYVSRRTNGIWQKAEPMPPPINTPDNEGAQSISADGTVLYFTACNRKGGVGKCDIFFSTFDGKSWTVPKNLGSPVNTVYNEKQPSIAPDGKTLYFVSERPGGKGKMDIWKSEKTIAGKWGAPVNLGDSINTPEDEQAPFIHPDNKTLYFSSKGHVGMGGSDIYISRLKDNGTWGKATNFGYPINSPNDEMGIIVNARGDQAYFSSDRIKEMGLDIFQFEMPMKTRPNPVSYMKGTIYDAENRERLKAFFQVIELASGDTVSSAESNATNGEFLITIPTEKNYLLNISKKGYLFFSENFQFSGEYSNMEPFEKDIPLKPIRLNSQMVLKNIFYQTGSYFLLQESKIELDKVYELLSLNPNLKIEIGGHTDNVGTEAYNIELSQKRAQSVVDFLVEKGIAPNRLFPKGYGETLPVESNSTEEGRSANRRTELKIVEI
jgi:outer membrane protein OmpA-like peptidoglycan-associated protein